MPKVPDGDTVVADRNQNTGSAAVDFFPGPVLQFLCLTKATDKVLACQSICTACFLCDLLY